MFHRTLFALGAVALLGWLNPAYPDDDTKADKSSTATAAKDEKKKDAAKDAKKAADKARVAVFRMHGTLAEAPPQEELFIFGGSKALTLRELVDRFKKAAEDP